LPFGALCQAIGLDAAPHPQPSPGRRDDSKHFLEHSRVFDHLHMGRHRQMAIVRAGQGRAAGRKDDVVAMAPETGETPPGLGTFPRCQPSQPVAAEPHLSDVRASTVRAKPGAGVRRRDRHEAVACRCRVRCQPSAGRQAAHAVGDDHRRESRRLLQTTHRVGDRRAVIVDGAEDGLEAHGDAGNVVATQLPEPAIPQPSIAEEAMNEEDAAPAGRFRRDVIGLAFPAKRLTPQENARRHHHLQNPRAKELAESRARIIAFGIGRPQARELERENGAVSGHDEDNESRPRPRGSGSGPGHDRGDGQREQGHGDELLEAREHRIRRGNKKRPPSIRRRPSRY